MIGARTLEAKCERAWERAHRSVLVDVRRNGVRFVILRTPVRTARGVEWEQRYYVGDDRVTAPEYLRALADKGRRKRQ